MTKRLFPKENKIYRMVRKMFPKNHIISKFLGIHSQSLSKLVNLGKNFKSISYKIQ
jgi:hypothetical protein